MGDDRTASRAPRRDSARHSGGQRGPAADDRVSVRPECPGTDLRDVLARRTDFDVALSNTCGRVSAS
jgi:hypothetical protein